MAVQILSGTKALEPPSLVRVYGVTEEQFDEWTDEDTPYELLDGVMIVHSPASFEHEELFTFILTVLNLFVHRHRLGRVVGSRAVLRLRPGRRVEPDVLFLSSTRQATVDKIVEGTADLVIEISSPSTREYDFGEKRRAYKDARTPELWFIDPMGRQVLHEVRSGRSYRSRVIRSGKLRSVSVPGFFLELAWLWQEPPPDPMACLEAILAAQAPIRRTAPPSPSGASAPGTSTRNRP